MGSFIDKGSPKTFHTQTIERQCEMPFVDELAPLAEGIDAILSLGCGAGVQFIAERFADTEPSRKPQENVRGPVPIRVEPLVRGEHGPAVKGHRRGALPEFPVGAVFGPHPEVLAP